MADTKHGVSSEDNAQQAKEKADCLFPGERWREVEPHIFIAAQREPKNKQQQQTLAKELEQARILVQQGSVVYLLPECSLLDHEKHPDAVVDGYVMEFKTITGSIREVEKRFKESRRKADRVFFKIDAPLSSKEVARKLSGIIRAKAYSGGRIVVYLSESGELWHWNVDDLK